MKIITTILPFFLIISLGGEMSAIAAVIESLPVQEPVNQEGGVDIATKANKTLPAQKTANRMINEFDQAAVTKALEIYLLEHGELPTSQEDIQALVEKTLIDNIPERQRQEGSHNGDSDVQNSVAENNDVLNSVAENNDVLNSVADKKYVDDEPVIAMKQESIIKQESIESPVTMGEETEVISMVELIKTEILIFAVTFTAVLAVIFDKQLLFILKLLFGSLKKMARTKAESVTS